MISAETLRLIRGLSAGLLANDFIPPPLTESGFIPSHGDALIWRDSHLNNTRGPEENMQNGLEKNHTLN